MAFPNPELMSIGNGVFRTYLFCSSALVLKMMFMSFYTALQRTKNKAFANPEDGKRLNIKPKVDENVERVRRAHLNDLENISIFFVSGYIYTLTDPTENVAKALFMAYTLARYVHSFVYAIVVIPQPARALSFGVGFFITGYMAVRSLIYFS